MQSKIRSCDRLGLDKRLPLPENEPCSDGAEMGFGEVALPMSNYLGTFGLPAVLVAALVLLGCQRSPVRVHPPGIDVVGAGKQAMEMYDKDGDGVVKGPELDAAPPLKLALKNLDTDGDGGVNAEEVTARINVWKESRIGMKRLSCTVRRKGRPLPGATVTFEPEKFLGDEVQVAMGTTNSGGMAVLVIPDRQPSGVSCGFYLVKISLKQDDQETIPPIYNEQTILGQEVAPDTDGRLFFNLTE